MDRGAWGLQSMGSQRVGHNWATNNLVYIYNIFCIHSSIKGFLFPCLMCCKQCYNEHVDTYLFKLVFFSSDKYSEVKLLNHIVVLYLIFLGSSIMFSMMDTPIYIPTITGQVFSFLHIIADSFYILSFW